MDLNIRILDFSHNNILLYKIVIHLLPSSSFQPKIAMHSQFSNTLQFKNVMHPQLSIFSLLLNVNMNVHNISKTNLRPAFINNSLKDYKDVLDKDNQKDLPHQLHVILDLDAAWETETNIYMQIFNRPLKMMHRIIRLKIRTLILQILSPHNVQNLKTIYKFHLLLLLHHQLNLIQISHQWHLKHLKHLQFNRNQIFLLLHLRHQKHHK